MQNFGDVLQRNKGLGPGFDFLRLWLACSVLWFHSFVVIGEMNWIESTPAWYYIHALMPMFFALSGFLIAGSAERLNLSNFLVNRGLRIVPALAVEIIISAFLIGTTFTTFPLDQYFTDITFWHYFTNIFGWIQYQLPGVFIGLPSDGVVNQSLWTIPFEVGCYVLISLVIIFRLAKYPQIILLITIALLVIPIMFQWAGTLNSQNKTSYTLLNYVLFSRGALLFPSFLLGAFFYFVRYKIPFSTGLALICIITSVLLAVFGNEHWRNFYLFNLVSVPPLVYLTLFLGCCNIPKVPFYSKGDYSYGIYLYGYPLQQALFATFRALHFWFYHFVASIALATVAATFSWHFIEKPILQLRKKFSFVVRKRIEE